MTTITIGSNTYNLVAMPTAPAPSDIELGFNDATAVNPSPFTRQEQVQQWPGGDFWDATITLPPMTRALAWPWEGFLAELRGRSGVFQLGDPRAKHPLGSGLGVPVINTSTGPNLPMTNALVTRGWRPSTARILVRGDQFQVGYRLYRVCEDASSDSGGNATLTIWPSIRETPADGAALSTSAPRGLFRLQQNRRTIQSSLTRLTTLSLPCVEAR